MNGVGCRSTGIRRATWTVYAATSSLYRNRSRTTFLTQLARSEATLAEAQGLARHSDPRLNAKHSTKLLVDDLAGAVGKRPSANPAEPMVARMVAQAGATD
jgi:hypothetical protein